MARLSGGAPVYLLEDRDVPLVRLFLAFRGGSLYDPPEKAGLADVTALAWRTGGAAGLEPEQIDEALEDRGMELSVSLGRETGWIRLSVLPADLESGLDLLARVVREPEFRHDRVEWAVGQVAERVQREVDDPVALAFRELRRVLYKGHPRGVIPTVDTVRRASRTDVSDFHARLLREGSWVLGAAGDFDEKGLVEALEARFAGLPCSGPAFAPLPPPRPPEPRLILVPRALPQSTIAWARFGPPIATPAYYALEVVDFAVGSGGFQSLLVREIRSDRGLAYSVGSFYEAFPEFGVLGVHAQTKAESTREVLGLVRDLLGGVASQGVPPIDLDQSKQALVNRHIFRYEDPAASVREQMALRLDGLPPNLSALYPIRIPAVSGEDAARVAAAHYTGMDGVTVVVGKVDPGDAAWGGGPPVQAVEAR